MRWRGVKIEVGEGGGAKTHRALLVMARSLDFALSEMGANGRF